MVRPARWSIRDHSILIRGFVELGESIEDFICSPEAGLNIEEAVRGGTLHA